MVGTLAQVLFAIMANMQLALQVPQGNSEAAAERLLVERIARALADSQA